MYAEARLASPTKLQGGQKNQVEAAHHSNGGISACCGVSVDGNRLDSWSKVAGSWLEFDKVASTCQLRLIMSSLRRLSFWHVHVFDRAASSNRARRNFAILTATDWLPRSTHRATVPSKTDKCQCQLPMPHRISRYWTDIHARFECTLDLPHAAHLRSTANLDSRPRSSHSR